MSINQTGEVNCSDPVTEGKACASRVEVSCGSEQQITTCKCQTALNCLECNSEDPTKCKLSMKVFKFEYGLCTICEDGYDSLGDFCFAYQANSGRNLSGGAVAGIVVAVLVVYAQFEVALHITSSRRPRSEKYFHFSHQYLLLLYRYI
uniref:Cysteine-rich membrane protein 2 n=1 Tax=Spironucleus salmonicida TaxID=348837 RepID=V6LX40_9EUKA|eukprot:EST45384.1 Cysteine-rich membrane protein 2 [Spironucleus salmonicida]